MSINRGPAEFDAGGYLVAGKYTELAPHFVGHVVPATQHVTEEVLEYVPREVNEPSQGHDAAPQDDPAGPGTIQVLTRIWESTRQAALVSDFSFRAQFSEEARLAQWRITEVKRSEQALFLCRNDVGTQVVVFNPIKSSDVNIAKFFENVAGLPQPTGRMCNWTLVEPAVVAEGHGEELDVLVQSDTITRGKYKP